MVVAGLGNNGYLDSAEVYNWARRTWSKTSPMTQARFYHTTTLLSNGNVLVTGGFNGDSGSGLDSAEIWRTD
jgi:hypothetical protein